MTTALFIDKEGTTIDQLTTVEDCDKAVIWLTDAIVSIENSAPLKPAARKALKFRRLALQRVQERRADLRKGHLLHVVERLNPEVVAEARRMSA